jgi:carboxypeptidase PM20D1
MKVALRLLAAAVLLLVAVLAVRTVRFGTRQIIPSPAEPLTLASAGVIERLGQAIRLPTVSEEDSARRDPSQLVALHRLLETAYPRVSATLTREVVNGYSLLYTWPGVDPSAQPLLFISHMDVVPADSARWSRPPFAGAVSDGFIWGRGTLDDKCGVLGVLEAVEALASAGFRPRRTVYLGFGHDEELRGQGARAIAALLQARRVRLEAVVDEGGAVLSGIVPGVAAPVATVGVAEKGSVSLALTTHAPGGHSSMPPPETAIGRLSRAVDRLERNPFPATIGGAELALFRAVGPEMVWPYRILFANLWLFEPLVLRKLTASPPTAASVRTTLAPTLIQGGIKENVLPASARAVVNLRILPGETVASVLQRVREVVADTSVDVSVVGEGEDPSPVSPSDGSTFQALAGAIRQVYPTAIVAPFLVVGATDARHYTGLTPNVYRFAPLPLTQVDLDRFHGVDERIGLADYLRAVRWYAQAIRLLAGDGRR